MPTQRQFLVVGRALGEDRGSFQALMSRGSVLQADDLADAQARLRDSTATLGDRNEAPELVAAFVDAELLPIDAWPRLPTIALVERSEQYVAAVEAGADFLLSLPLDPALLDATLALAARLRNQRFCDAAARAVIDRVSDAVGLTDGAGRLLAINPAFTSMTGYSAEEAIGKTGPQLFQCRSLENVDSYRACDAHLRAGREWAGPMTSRHRDGSPLHHYATLRPLMDERGAVRRQVVIKQHLPFAMTMARGSAEAERLQGLSLDQVVARLAHSEARYRAMMLATGDAIFVADLEHGNILDLNPAAVALLDYQEHELRGRGLADFVVDADRAAVMAWLDELSRSGSVGAQRFRLNRRCGQVVWVTMASASFDAGRHKLSATTVRDITADVDRERKLEQTAAQLASANQTLERSAKMASLGSLAGALAHEINNPLHFVSLAAEELATRLPVADDGVGGLLADIAEGLRRLRSTTRSVLPFARKASDHPERVDLNEIVELAYKMAHNEVQHRARAELRLDVLPSLVGHRGLLGQLLVNLIINAAQAIEEGDATHQTIEIRTRHIGDSIELSVSDSGCGVMPSMREKIFEPLFTTKSGAGTGLGLSICLDVIHAHGATMSVEDSPLGGAIFRIRFPIDNGLREPSVDLRPLRERGGRVLVVDDEPAALRAYARVLKRAYRVELAEGGLGALSMISEAAERGERFDAIVCDVMMPDLDGRQLYEIVAGRHATMADRFLFCTGGAFTQRTRDFLRASGRPVLEKPTNADELRRAIASVIDAAERPSGSYAVVGARSLVGSASGR